MYDPLKYALPLTMVEKMYVEKDPSPVTSDIQDDRSHGNDELEMGRVESKGVRGSSVDDDRLNLQDPESATDQKEPREESIKPTPERPVPRAEDYYGFAHPATSRPQRTVWIPKDHLGLSEEEERACWEKGIDISSKDAEMNEKGKVELTGDSQPPDLVRE